MTVPVLSRMTGVGIDPYIATLNYRTGAYYGTPYPMTGGGGAITQNTVYYVPIWIGKRQAFDRISIGVATAVASSVARLGIYDVNAAGDLPGALILDASTVATATTGLKEITISQTLDPGVKFLAVVGQTAGGVDLNRHTAAPWPFGTTSTGVTSSFSGSIASQTGVTGALPSTATPVVAATSDMPRILLRAA